MASFALALIVLLSTLGVVSADGHENNTNETEVFMYGDAPTPLPTESGELPVTTFKISIGIEDPTLFDLAEFRRGLAAVMGVNPDQVTLSEVTFELSTSYVVAGEAISLTDATTAITAFAAQVDISADQVTVTVGNDARRLSQDGSRRLASHSSTTINGKLSIPVAEAATAMGAKTALASTAGVATLLGVDASKVTGGEVTIMVVATAAVQSTSSTPVAAPTAQAFLDKMKELAPGKTWTLGTVESIPDPTNAPTKAPTEEEEESGTPKLSGLMHLAGILVSGVALNAVTL